MSHIRTVRAYDGRTMGSTANHRPSGENSILWKPSPSKRRIGCVVPSPAVTSQTDKLTGCLSKLAPIGVAVARQRPSGLTAMRKSPLVPITGVGKVFAEGAGADISQ